MSAVLRLTLSTLRPVHAALVGAPAVAGWLFAGGGCDRIGGGLAVSVGAWLLALAAFAWNDRADLIRGTAGNHRRAEVRALERAPDEAGRWLLGIGGVAAGVALALYGTVGAWPAALAVVVAFCGWTYSDPVYFGKGRPVAAGWLHLAGGAANGAAGVIAAGGDGRTALVWGAYAGALFFAAHRIHAVGDREEDLRAGVRTAATVRPWGEASRRAAAWLLGAQGLALVGAVWLGGAEGVGIAAAAVWIGAGGVAAASSGLLDRTRWRTFQATARLLVAGGVALGIGAAWLARGWSG